MADLSAAHAAIAAFDDNLGQALDMLGEDRLGLTPAQAARADDLVVGYIRLAGIALEQFEEAARGT